MQETSTNTLKHNFSSVEIGAPHILIGPRFTEYSLTHAP